MNSVVGCNFCKRMYLCMFFLPSYFHSLFYSRPSVFWLQPKDLMIINHYKRLHCNVDSFYCALQSHIVRLNWRIASLHKKDVARWAWVNVLQVQTGQTLSDFLTTADGGMTQQLMKISLMIVRCYPVKKLHEPQKCCFLLSDPGKTTEHPQTEFTGNVDLILTIIVFVRL